MEHPAKRQRLSPPAERQQKYEASSDDDEFYAPAALEEQPPQPPHARKETDAREETDADDEVEILDEGEEVEEIDEAEVNIRRTQSLNKVRSRWDEICAKYGRDFENADEIDLNTLEVVVNKGHIAQMRDENDVGNAHPTHRSQGLKAQHVVDRVLSRPQDGGEKGNTYRALSPSKSQNLPKAEQTIYEDESSDDGFLYEKPAPSVVLAARQPQGINQVKPRSGSRTVFEKRTVITTRRITTSTIRDDRPSSRDENGRQRSHENTREVHRYKTSQEKIVESSSDDELVQRSPRHPPAQTQDEVERPPSPKGKVSLWAPRMKAGRPRLAYDERGTPQRHLSRRDRTPRYDEHGRKIRKQRNDRGKMRKPEHLRKTKFVQRYPHLHQGSGRSETSMTENPSSPPRVPAQGLQLPSDRTDSSMSAPTTTSEEVPKLKPAAKPALFTRNQLDKSYDFSDEEDDALPQRVLPSLLTASPADLFIGQETALGTKLLHSKLEDVDARLPHQKPDGPIFNPHSRSPPDTEYDYQPSLMSACKPSIHHTDPAAPIAHMAQMQTLHGFIPVEDDSHNTSGFMNTCLSFPETSQVTVLPHQAYSFKPHESTQSIKKEAKQKKEDLSIPIDPALLALDAENRAASLERAQLTIASDLTDEPAIEGTPMLILPFDELGGYKKPIQKTIIEDDEYDSDEELFAPVESRRIGEAVIDKQYLEKDDGRALLATSMKHEEESAMELKEVVSIPRGDEVEAPEILSRPDVVLPVERLQEQVIVPEAIATIYNVEQVEVLENDGDTHLPSPKEPEPIALAETPLMYQVIRTEVPDSNAESDDELLTQPSSQPQPKNSVLSNNQITPKTKEAMKIARFSIKSDLDEIPRPKLSPTRSSILQRTENLDAPTPSSPSSKARPLIDPLSVMEQDDDEDDLALVPSTPTARSKSRTKAALKATSSTIDSSALSHAPAPTAPHSTPPISQASSIQPPDSIMERPLRKEFSSSKSVLKHPSSRSKSGTPEPAVKPGSELTPGSKSGSSLRATLPRFFSLSVSPQAVPRRKLRASLLSESASSTPRRAATATPPPMPAEQSGIRRRSAAGRLLSASQFSASHLLHAPRDRERIGHDQNPS